ncbi:MAG TPA: valine--tRNA ligase [Thermoanaerobaculia bacterium]|nr:valine--tRNA ligase [Thermoanaerobaculia bacterium]
MEKIELPTRFDPKDFEERLYASWKEAGYFTPEAEPERPRFSMVIPPPNVTGRLHIGHALVNTLQDIIVRWKRMSGFNTLWLPGTDHAGIATQMVVERELAREGVRRIDLGREQFEKRVWEWKEEYGGAIVQQLERLGVSCDWTRMRFTLDEGLSRAVRHVFVRLYEDGLIYRSRSMVNWCPRCHTAISDIEVEYRENEGNLWNIEYPLSDGSGSLTVATTRPETMLGDTAVAVHPDDERYRALIGRSVRLPLTGREIPVIADPILVDPAFGTGVVKVTPAHDRNDYEAGQRNGLAELKVIDEAGRMTPAAGAAFAGLDRFEARTKVVEMLREQGLLGEIKQHANAVGHHGKCDTIVEPMISMQWFVKIEPLAGPAIEAVRSGAVRITPSSWESTYFNWMENIHDWCISRQLWWGHRIPAWYCDDCGEVIVSETDPEVCPKCSSSSLRRETDVLDTWFSSGLWPFSTMGWPEETKDFRTFYPTDTLITAFDILFFWVARMIMMGLRFTGTVPFREVYIHGLVRDEHGQKMSKSKGNVIDPLEVIDQFGADAVRFTLAILSAGRDIPLAENRMQGYSAFATKIWNASRFAMMHVDTRLEDADRIHREDLSPVERWILSRVNAATNDVNKALSVYRFDEAANAIYQFFWHEFCDWYIEMAKPVLLEKAGDKKALQQSRRVLLEVLDRSLRLLHPFMPFITEEIWLKLGGVEPSIVVAPYPIAEEVLEDPEAERLIGTIQQIVTSVRNLRAERGYTPKDRFRLFITTEDEREARGFEANAYLLMSLARLSEVLINQKAPGDAHRDHIGTISFAVELPKKEMSAEDRAKLEKQIEQVEREIASTQARLADEKFVSRAPSHVVEQSRAREGELQQRLAKLRQNLAGAA